MQHTFTLVYDIPLSLIQVESALNELGNYGLRGGSQDGTVFKMWFSCQAETQEQAISNVKEAVAEALPLLQFVSVEV